MSEDDSEVGQEFAVILDYLPYGRSDDDRPQYQKSPVAFVIGESDFKLYELALEKESGLNIEDRVAIDPPDDRIEDRHPVSFDDLSSSSRSELEPVVENIVDRDEERFVDFYNEAQPITLRLHQLNLLPGIGKKLRNNILEERKRGPFESFEEMEQRVSGLHRPREILIERIIEEIRDEDLKYRRFVG
ncbi:DUF655 domain-containing protein [Halobacteriaceae archaeon GCM10025711]